MNSLKNDEVSSKEITTENFHAFRDRLKEVSGIILSDSKKDLIFKRLSGLISQYKLNSFAELLEKMKSDPGLRESIMAAVTINETTWFRDSYPYEVFKEKLLPEIARAQPQRVRVWSAACSTGEEPYLVSMAAEEYTQNRPNSLPANAVRILATDISPTAIKKALSGRYEEIAISRGLSTEKKLQFFNDIDSGWEVNEEIKKRVTFSELNLRQDYKALGRFDIIFCRNVLNYFSSELKADIVSRMASALNPGGYLVLGNSESIAEHYKYFDVISWRDGVVYKLKT